MNAPDLIETRYRVKGMDCPSCVTKIETAVKRIPNVAGVHVSIGHSNMVVRHSTAESTREKIEAVVKALGYGIAVPGNAESSDGAEPVQAWWRSKRGQLTILSGAALIVAYAVGLFVTSLGNWPFVVAMLIGLVPVGRRALGAALTGTPFSIEMLMTIAAMGAMFIGAAEEAAVVVFLFLVGELLEGVATRRARASIASLADLVPKTALVEVGKRTREVPADTLRPGMVILVRPGDRIPADGVIVEGDSTINEAPVTGESVPKRKTLGDPVLAGTINGDGALRVKVTATASDNTIARVVKLVEEAQESKAPTERFIDRFSRYYTPAVLLFGAAVAVLPPLVFGEPWAEWVYKGLAVLLIGCPCALVISTPAAIAAALSAGARRGLLMKGGAVLEGLGKTTLVAFDKTGTLTKGKPQVTDVVGYGMTEKEVLTLAAALEVGSSHPLALAILDHAAKQGADVTSAQEITAEAGRGVTGKLGRQTLRLTSAAAQDLTNDQIKEVAALNAQGKTVSVLAADNRVIGLLAMRDEAREDALRGLQELRRRGLRTVMLTGDNQRTAQAIGEALGVEVRAELLPKDKQRIVRELQQEGANVAKVGDGINDAPALATADTGIAMGGATGVALETADAAILHGRVLDVAALIELSQQTMRIIRQNIAVAIGLKVMFLITTVLGITGLWPAILADTGATVLVTLNALRLLQPPVPLYRDSEGLLRKT